MSSLQPDSTEQGHIDSIAINRHIAMKPCAGWQKLPQDVPCTGALVRVGARWCASSKAII
jgi:hypothetical protein